MILGTSGVIWGVFWGRSGVILVILECSITVCYKTFCQIRNRLNALVVSKGLQNFCNLHISSLDAEVRFVTNGTTCGSVNFCQRWNKISSGIISTDILSSLIFYVFISETVEISLNRSFITKRCPNY